MPVPVQGHIAACHISALCITWKAAAEQLCAAHIYISVHCLLQATHACRRVQEAVEKAQAEAMQKAAASSSGGATELTVGKAIEASKEAAAQLAAKGLSHQAGPDPADGPSR